VKLRLSIAGVAALVACAAATAAAPAPVRVAAALEPSAVLYGDPVTAMVTVQPGAVDPAEIRVLPSFTPYVVTAGPVVRRLHSGGVSYTYTLACVTNGCLPTNGPRIVRLEPVKVTVGSLHASGAWPALRVSSRLTAGDLAGPVRFRSSPSPPPPAYRISPGLLAVCLLAAAAACLLAALAVLGISLGGRRRRAARPARGPLELAVAYVRDSAGRSGPDRRRALSLLAEATDRDEPALAAVAGDTAWSRPVPTPHETGDLADRASQLERPSG
jgi:hypothetical protein